MVNILQDARRDFENIPINKTNKPLVGIVGEIFVRNHPYSNNEIINVLPFTCIPGNIVNASSKRIREEYKIPWLNLAFDGLEQGTTETRLEAFMYQAKQYMKNKK